MSESVAERNQEPYNVYSCMHCQMHITNIEEVPTHDCFIGKDVYVNSNNVFYAPDYTPEVVEYHSPVSNEEADEDAPSTCVKIKTPAIWTDTATMALLSLYEAHKGMLDNPKKQCKLWQSISDGLLESFGIEMSKEQVRWKMNALHQKYKDVIDNNSKSGRGAIDFRWFTQLEEIFGQQKEHAVAASHTTSSGFPFLQGQLASSLTKALTHVRKQNQKYTDPKLVNSALLEGVDADSSMSTSIAPRATVPSRVINSSEKLNKDTGMAKGNLLGKRARPPRGTGSNLSQRKLKLENQWIDHLEKKEKRDIANDERYAKLAERKKDELQLKKRQLAMKEKELELRKQIAEEKLKANAYRTAELLRVEEKKCKLMKKYFKLKNANE